MILNLQNILCIMQLRVCVDEICTHKGAQKKAALTKTGTVIALMSWQVTAFGASVNTWHCVQKVSVCERFTDVTFCPNRSVGKINLRVFPSCGE